MSKRVTARQIAALRERHAAIVDDVSDEQGDRASADGYGDGVWFYLRSGYCGDPATHAVHEWDLSRLRSALANVKPCDCEQCLAAANAVLRKTEE